MKSCFALAAAATLAGASALEAGTPQTITLEHDGIMREAILYVPAGLSTESPLLFNSHALFANATGQMELTGFNDIADEEGFAVVYPNGLDSSWNGGVCCDPSAGNMVDDVGFFRALFEHVKGLVPVDTSRVYATGMSNGGFLTQRLGCEASDIFAAIAPNSGYVANMDGALFECEPSRPVPVFHVHGLTDRIVPYDGSPSIYPGMQFESAPVSIEGWQKRNGIENMPTTESYSGTNPGFFGGSTNCQTTGDNDRQVTLCTHTGGHNWGENYGMDVSREMWKFLSTKTLN
jgi:polyhydroxybutyrate depolymerase